MTLGPHDPTAPDPSGPPATEPPDAIDPELAALGYLPPDEDEPPPVELSTAVGDVQPWGTLLTLLAWAGVFLLMAMRHQVEDSAGLLAWGASVTGVPRGEAAWRLLASTFVHAGAAHIFFNAVSMMVFGPGVERVLTRWAFPIVYALGGAAASAASLAWRTQRGGYSLSVGGSGALFALGGALLVSAWRLRRHLPPSRARAMAAALLLLVVQGFVGGLQKSGTDNAAHAAGLLSGAVLGLVLPLSERLGGRGAPWPVRVLGTLCALALLAALALALRSGLALG